MANNYAQGHKITTAFIQGNLKQVVQLSQEPANTAQNTIRHTPNLFIQAYKILFLFADCHPSLAYSPMIDSVNLCT
jgi:hypothetical protein